MDSVNRLRPAFIVIRSPSVLSVTLTFSGSDYLTGFMLPNFFFHVTTAYGLLRHKGVNIGKMDFLGGV